tara:strand:+ start:2997 stop:4184 length:1188 start_codon:yes stop_codon:yes gene_type:complete
MQKKSILNRALVSIALFFLFCQFIQAQLSFLDTKCLWVVRESIYDKESIDAAFFHAYHADYDVVYVQVRGRGYAFYESNIVPKNPKINIDFDPLEYAIKLGNALGIEVHAWVNTYILWSSKYEPIDTMHLYHQRKDWTEANIHGKMDSQIKLSSPQSPQWEGVFLSPIHPEVNSYLLSVFSEIINEYDVDGIHLDYIRFQDEIYGYNRIGMKEFEKIYNINPRDIVRGIISTHYGWEQSLVDSIKNEWNNFRQDAISSLVKNIYSVIEKSEKKIYLSAAVKPNLIEARSRWSQDWGDWLHGDFIDFVVPMNYYKEIRHFNNSIQIIKTNLDDMDINRIIMGISTYNQDVQSAIDKILLTRLNGFKGISIFSYDSHKNNLEWFDPLIEALGTKKYD